MDTQLSNRITALITYGFPKKLIAKIAGISERQMYGHGTLEWNPGKRTKEKLLVAVKKLEKAIQ